MVSTTRNQKKEIAHSKKSTAITKAAAAVTPNHHRKRHDKNNKNDENPMQHEQTDAEDQHDSPSRRRQPLAEQSVNNETSLDHRETRTEMDLLRAENLRLRQERDAALEHNSGAPETIQPIPKPNGEAGTRGFKLIDAMGLSKENQEEYKMYKAIQRSVRTFVIRSGIDLTEDFKHIDTEKLCNVYKLTRKTHPYMTKQRFKADWATAEFVKQYMKNFRRYEVRKGRMDKRAARKGRAATNRMRRQSGGEPELPIDSAGSGSGGSSSDSGGSGGNSSD